MAMMMMLVCASSNVHADGSVDGEEEMAKQVGQTHARSPQIRDESDARPERRSSLALHRSNHTPSYWNAAHGVACGTVRESLLQTLKDDPSLRHEQQRSSWAIAERDIHVFLHGRASAPAQRVTIVVSQGVSPFRCELSTLMSSAKLLHAGRLLQLPCLADDTVTSVAVHELVACEQGELRLFLESRWCTAPWSGPMHMAPPEQVVLFNLPLTCLHRHDRTCSPGHFYGYGIIDTQRTGERLDNAAVRAHHARGSWHLLDDGRYLLTAAQYKGITRHGEPQVAWLNDEVVRKQPMQTRPVSSDLNWSVKHGFVLSVNWSNGNMTQSAMMSDDNPFDDGSEGAFEWRPHGSLVHGCHSAAHFPGLAAYLRLGGARRIFMAGMSRTRVLMYEIIRLVDSAGHCADCVKLLNSTSKEARVSVNQTVAVDFSASFLPHAQAAWKGRVKSRSRTDAEELEVLAFAQNDTNALVEQLSDSLRKNGYCHKANGNFAFISLGSHEMPARLFIEAAPLFFARLFKQLLGACIGLRFAYVSELPWLQPYDTKSTAYDRLRLETFDPDRIDAINQAARSQAYAHGISYIDLHGLVRARIDALADGAHPYARWQGMWNNSPPLGRTGNAIAARCADALLHAASLLSTK